MNIIGYRTVVLAVLALMGLAAHSQNNDDPNISGWDAPAGYYTLSIERFHHWDGCESWSQVIDDYASREIRLNETLSVGNVVYGHYAVMYNDYADLSGFYALQIEGTPGMKLRVLLNRKEPGVDWEGRDWDDHGGGFVELTPVISSEGKITVPFIGYDFVHLNAIKIHGESPEGQITALTMIKGAYEDPTTGPASGKYYLKNLATGRYWGIGNDYGTRASLVEDPEYIILHRQDNGTYLMETQTMNTDDPEYQNWKYFGGDFMDNEWAQPLVFSMVEDGWFTIRADNGCYYGNDGSSTVLGKWLDQNDWNTRWQILTEDQMINDLNVASFDNEMNAAFLILDPNFNRNNVNQWAWNMDARNQNLCGGEDNNRCAESWRSVFTLSQTLNVPNGHYKLTAQATVTDYANLYDGADYPVIYANDASVAFTSMEQDDRETDMWKLSNSFSEGRYYVTIEDVEVTNGQLTIGARGTRTDTWAIWDNFRLFYKGAYTPEEFVVNKLRFHTKNDGTARVMGIDGECPEAITIPSQVSYNGQTYTVTEIGGSAFAYQSNLRMVVIPATYNYSYWRPFEGCTNLEYVVMQGNEANGYGDDYIFPSDVCSKATLYVPVGAKGNYEGRDQWRQFKAIKELPSRITLTANSEAINYGDPIPTHSYKATDGPLVGEPTLFCSASTSSNAGEYNIIMSKGTTISPVPLVFNNAKLTINKVQVTVSVGNYSKKQGAAMPTFKITYSGFVKGQTESVLTQKATATCSANANSAPGKYDITPSGAVATNYTFNYKSGTLTVTKADAIVVTAKSYTINYGAPLPTFEYTVSGGTLSGKPTLRCKAAKVPEAGTYDIVVSKGTVTNYGAEFINGTLTVKKGMLTVSVGDYTKYTNEEMPEFHVKYEGFVNGETDLVMAKIANVSCEATKFSPVGTYPIRLSGAAAANYDITYVDGTLTVKQAYKMSITTEATGSVTYGSNNVTSYAQFDVKDDKVVLKFNPKNGYVLSKLMINGSDKTYAVNNNTYTITKLSEDINVVVSFKENNDVNPIVDGIKYQILSAPNHTVIVDYYSIYRDHLKIPARILYNNQWWDVVGVADNAFLNRPALKSVELPASITSANTGRSLFTGCSALAAIVWNADFKPSLAQLGVIDNPNLLFYVTKNSNAPDGFSNIVVNGVAETITLKDATSGTGNFYCPQKFVAKSVSYVHSYIMESAIGGVQGWETLALPFTVQKVEHSRAGVIVPFAQYSAGQRPFWLYTYGPSGFVRSNVIEANKGYIICMPNNTEYDSEYCLGGDVTFSATNVNVEASSWNYSQKRGEKEFVPAFCQEGRSSKVYALNVVNRLHSESGNLTPGSAFVKSLRSISPFECYLTVGSSNAREYYEIEFDETTAIEVLAAPATSGVRQRVYSLTGQLLIDANSSETLEKALKQLPAGVYIVNGKKQQIK